MAIQDIQGGTKRIIEVTCDGKGRLRRVPLEKLQRFQGALKSLGEDQYRKLKDSIAKHGFFVPVFVWRNKILDGHQRLLVIEKEQWAVRDGVPVVDIEAETESDAAEKLLLISSTYGKIEPQGLYDFTELHDIPLTVSDLPDLPDFDLEGFKNAFYEEEEEDEGAADEVPDAPEVPISKTGDLWLLGDHRLLCGDSTSGEDVARLMDGRQADMVFTDPPYGMGGYGGRRKLPLMGDDQDVFPFYAAIPDAKEIYVWGRVYNYSDLNFEPRDIIIWKKNNFGLGVGYRGQYEVCFYKGDFKGSDSDVWEVDKDVVYEHPTQKPVELALRAIKNSGPQVVMDLFLGSGSTLIACEKSGRQCYGLEIDPVYCDVIVKRWEIFTGQEARLEDGGRTFGEVAEERSGTNKLEAIYGNTGHPGRDKADH